MDDCISSVPYSRTGGNPCQSGSPGDLERRRLRALDLLKEGLLPVEVARRVSVDRIRSSRYR